jgi:N-acetylneuraminic acid mutarotase
MRYLLLLTLTGITILSCKKSSVAPAVPVVISSVSPLKDGPGAPITIIGTGFGTDSMACSVLFNGKSAIVESFSDTLLKVRVPSNAINGKIQVKSGTQSAFSKDDFTLLSGTWNRKTDFPGDGRTNLVSFTIGNKAYVGLGDSNGPVYNDLYEYDAATNTWTKKANLPGTGLNRATAVSAGGKGYVICGTSPGSILKNELWEYDPVVNNWTKKADLPTSGRFYAAGFSINNKIYFGTGQAAPLGSPETYKDWWEYNPASNTWAAKKDIPFGAITNAQTFVIGTKAYLGATPYSNPTNGFWEYEATTDTWTRLSDFPGKSNYYASSFAINSKGYIAAGTGNECYEFDPGTNTWTQRTSHPYHRTGGIGFAIGNKGYLTTGSSMTYLDKDTWEFSLE